MRARAHSERAVDDESVKKCSGCGCTDADCARCVERTGISCSWSDVEPNLCTACEELGPPERARARGTSRGRR